MLKNLNIEIEEVIRFLSLHIPNSKEDSRKSILFHDIRVGTYLYEKNYSKDIILAWFLHDIIEWTGIDKQTIENEFGNNILRLILANSKDDSIIDEEEKISELIMRCVQNWQDALIIKTADIIDSFKWYSNQINNKELQYCTRNANAIFKLKPDNFNDKIFDELEFWMNNNGLS